MRLFCCLDPLILITTAISAKKRDSSISQNDRLCDYYCDGFLILIAAAIYVATFAPTAITIHIEAFAATAFTFTNFAAAIFALATITITTAQREGKALDKQNYE